MYLVPIGAKIPVEVSTADPATGNATDADVAPVVDVFAADADAGLLGNITLTKRTGHGIAGDYFGNITIDAGNFTAGETYTIKAIGNVGGILGVQNVLTFRVAPAENVAGVPLSDLTLLVGGAQSAADLKDFADAGYDPGTNKVAGVLLVDTATTVTNQLSAATIAAAVEVAIFNEGDATALLAAIAAKVEEFLINDGDASATLAAIATAVRTNLATELGRLDAAISTRAAASVLGSPAGVSVSADIAAAKADTAAILDDTGTAGVVVAAGSKTGYALSSSGLDAILIESGISASVSLVNDTGTQLTSINARQLLALAGSALAGVLAGANGNTTTMKPAGKPSGNTRISASVDSTGRLAITLRVPD